MCILFFFQLLYPLDIIIINNIFHPSFYKFSSHLVVSCEIRHEMEWKLIAMQCMEIGIYV